MNAVFVTAGPLSFASSRLRCFWPAQHLPGAAVVHYRDIQTGKFPVEALYQADTVIFQKVAAPDVMQALHRMGKRVIYDLCDPLHWFSPRETSDILPYVTTLTASTPALAADLESFADMPVTVIRDGLDLDNHYSPERIKRHEQTPRLRFVWYGIYANRIALYAAMANLERLHANGHRFELLLIDEEPGQVFEAPYQVIQWRWSLEREIEYITSADVALLPPYPGPWGLLKSANKSATAWALGLPVVDGLDYADMVDMFSLPRRAERGAEGRRWAEAGWDCRGSAAEWLGVLC